MSEQSTTPTLIFEPHNGHGSLDFDGNRWPFGYISNDSPRYPIFELNVPLGLLETDLTALALKMAAATELFSALTDLVRCVRGGDETAGVSMDDALQDADAALEKALASPLNGY